MGLDLGLMVMKAVKEEIACDLDLEDLMAFRYYRGGKTH